MSIQEESSFDRIKPIELSNTTVAGFIGFAEKGPFNKAVKINNFSQYREIFGDFTDFSYLAYSVNGYFRNGGRECVVVRIAHFDDNKSEGAINKANIIIKTVYDDECFSVESTIEGSCGNNIRVRIWHIISNASIVTHFDNEESIWVECEKPDLFVVGDFVNLRNKNISEHNKIVKIKKKQIQDWNT